MAINTGEGDPAPRKEVLVEARHQARTLLEQRNYAAAAPLFEQAVGLFGQEPDFLRDYALVLTALGGEKNIHKAIKSLVTAAKIDNENETPNEWTYIRTGEALGRTGKYEESLKAYEHARSLNPANPEVKFLEGDNREQEQWRLHDQGNTLFKEGRPVEALNSLEKAIVLVGENNAPWSVFDKGKIMLTLGHVDESIQDLEKARELIAGDQGETWVLSALGEAYTQKAKLTYKKAIELNPDNNEAKEKLSYLDKK